VAEQQGREVKETRKGSTPIKVYCLGEERARIEANAAAAGMSVSAFLLAVGQGYRVAGVVDAEEVRKLAQINGDQGRLGGLLKLWLTDDPRAAKFGPETIRAILRGIEKNQRALSETMLRIVRPRADEQQAS
jgi:hypothetical protein